MESLSLITVEKILSTLDHDSLERLAEALERRYALSCTHKVWSTHCMSYITKDQGILGLYKDKDKSKDAYLFHSERIKEQWMKMPNRKVSEKCLFEFTLCYINDDTAIIEEYYSYKIQPLISGWYGL